MPVAPFLELQTCSALPPLLIHLCKTAHVPRDCPGLLVRERVRLHVWLLPPPPYNTARGHKTSKHQSGKSKWRSAARLYLLLYLFFLANI